MRRIALLAVGTAAVWGAVRWRPFRMEVAGESMVPTLRPGDWALAVRSRSIERGDLVVVAHPSRPGLEMVKRVTAVPGDSVSPGRKLGMDEWFVAGDNPDASTDSRDLGPVPRSAIVGRILLVYWPAHRRGVVH